ncbi:hypothetical protein [Streptomyces sp. 8N706]|uniref:hypothetical protein n=1 Tax=Streptomyces sp. 8N706 TaxID=3457416 RepID=UPI003FD1EEBD
MLPDGATPAEQAGHEVHIAARLPEGHRYNKATTLVTENDEDPADIILCTLEDHLLPAFDYKPRYVGHQPWIDHFGNDLAAVTAECDAPAAPDDHDQHPAAEAESTPQADSEQEPEEDAEELEVEELVPQDQAAASEESPSPELDNDTEAALEPATDDADNGTENQTAPEPAPAPGRRTRKRSSKRRATATATEPA